MFTHLPLPPVTAQLPLTARSPSRNRNNLHGVECDKPRNDCDTPFLMSAESLLSRCCSRAQPTPATNHSPSMKHRRVHVHKSQAELALALRWEA